MLAMTVAESAFVSVGLTVARDCVLPATLCDVVLCSGKGT